MSPPQLRAAVLLFFGGSACVSTPSPTAAGSAPHVSDAARRSLRSSHVISIDEIARLPDASSAYELIRRLRPQMLRAHRAPGGPVVFVNGITVGGITALHEISSTSVLEIRWLSGIDATTRYGTGHGGGVILVTLR